jgi:DDB1- and CUL4-associated factor 13
MISASDALYLFIVRVSASIFSGDARFVLTGSDDGNVRIWKAKASEKLGVITARERAAIEYRESLKERWRMDLQVNKVARYALFCTAPRKLD